MNRDDKVTVLEENVKGGGCSKDVIFETDVLMGKRIYRPQLRRRNRKNNNTHKKNGRFYWGMQL